MLRKPLTHLMVLLTSGWLIFLLPVENVAMSEDELNQKILGRWISEGDPKSQWLFLPEGVLKRFYDGVEMSERKWEFTDVCEGGSIYDLQEWEYGILKITAMDDESDYTCYIVQGMESVLTLLRIPEGNLLIYERVVE